MKSFPVLTLKKGREKSIINRHPWVFSGGVEKKPKAKEGDIVEVRSSENELLGYGHWAPDVSLACRMFAFTKEPIDIGESFWINKFSDAFFLRHNLPELRSTDAFRLIHAEGDGLPGMIVDIYGTTASVQLRTEGAAQLEGTLLKFLTEGMELENIFIRTEKKEFSDEENPGGKWVHGNEVKPVISENEMQFEVDVEGGQKTGFFLDQRDNRLMVSNFAYGKKVLNAFSYTGGFSVGALAGDAESVTSVEISKATSALCEKNIKLNFPKSTRHQMVTEDCFRYLKDMKQSAFDVIVLDPPAFTKHASTVDKAARGYKEINLKALQKVAAGGFLFTFSCSQHISKDLFRKIVFGAASDAGREVRVVAQLSQGGDHPVSIYHPEGEYLKGLALYVS